MAKDMRSWIKQLEEADELIRSGQKVLGQGLANVRHVGLAFGTKAKEATTEFARRVDQELITCKKF